jgi:hypothetical protein
MKSITFFNFFNESIKLNQTVAEFWSPNKRVNRGLYRDATASDV